MQATSSACAVSPGRIRSLIVMFGMTDGRIQEMTQHFSRLH